MRKGAAALVCVNVSRSLYRVRRKDPKGFFIQRLSGGKWVNGLGSVRLVPYHLPELRAAKTVFVAEGERDVDTLRVWKVVATCNPMGAGNWRDEFSKTLKGKHVVILVHADEPGRRHAIEVARSVLPYARSVQVLELSAKDVSEWRERGGLREEFLELVRACPRIDSAGIEALEKEWFPAAAPPQPPRGALDLKWINQHVPIALVVRALSLKMGRNGKIHCWRPELHHHGDRTPSVSIYTKKNKVRCFGCRITLGPIDLVMQVLGKSVTQAAHWIADRFEVPKSARKIVKSESAIGILMWSGLWASLPASTRCIASLLAEFADRTTLTVQIGYQALIRFSGVKSRNAIAAALRKLQSMGWLKVIPGAREPGSVLQKVSTYTLTPQSDQLLQLAEAHATGMWEAIQTEKAQRAEAREERYYVR